MAYAAQPEKLKSLHAAKQVSCSSDCNTQAQADQATASLTASKVLKICTRTPYCSFRTRNCMHCNCALSHLHRDHIHDLSHALLWQHFWWHYDHQAHGKLSRLVLLAHSAGFHESAAALVCMGNGEPGMRIWAYILSDPEHSHAAICFLAVLNTSMHSRADSTKYSMGCPCPSPNSG